MKTFPNLPAVGVARLPSPPIHFSQVSLGTYFWLKRAGKGKKKVGAFSRALPDRLLYIYEKVGEEFARVVGIANKYVTEKSGASLRSLAAETSLGKRRVLSVMDLASLPSADLKKLIFCPAIGDNIWMDPRFVVAPYVNNGEGTIILKPFLDEQARQRLLCSFPVEGPCIVLSQGWTEYEVGWGCRPDGRTLHATEECRQSFIEGHDQWERDYHGDHPGSVHSSSADLNYWLYMVDRQTFEQLIAIDGSMWMSAEYDPNSILLYVWGDGSISTPDGYRERAWKMRRLLTAEIARRFPVLGLKRLPAP